MPRWLRMVRGAIVTGIAFAIGVGAITSVIGLVIWGLGGVSFRTMIETVARFSLVSSIIGVAFSGLLALTARGRPIGKLSIPHFASLGAAVGFLYFLLMGVAGAFNSWSLSAAVTNFLLLTVTGATSASALLLIARKGQPALKGVEPRQLDQG